MEVNEMKNLFSAIPTTVNAKGETARLSTIWCPGDLDKQDAFEDKYESVVAEVLETVSELAEAGYIQSVTEVFYCPSIAEVDELFAEIADGEMGEYLENFTTDKARNFFKFLAVHNALARENESIAKVLDSHDFGKGQESWLWDPLYKDLADELGDFFELSDEPQIGAVLYGPDMNGLFYTGKKVKEQIKLAEEFVGKHKDAGVDYFSPADIISCNIQRIGQDAPRLDSSNSPDGWSFQRFVEYGLIKTPGGLWVPDAGVRGNGQFHFCRSNDDANSGGGVRFAVRKKVS